MKFLKRHWPLILAIGMIAYFVAPLFSANPLEDPKEFNPAGGGNPAGGATGAW